MQPREESLILAGFVMGRETMESPLPILIAGLIKRMIDAPVVKVDSIQELVDRYNKPKKDKGVSSRPPIGVIKIDEEGFLGKSPPPKNAVEEMAEDAKSFAEITKELTDIDIDNIPPVMRAGDTPPLEKKPRKKYTLSEEAKITRRASLEKARAARTAKRLSVSPADDEDTPPRATRINTPPDVLIEKHKDYIGEREDATLVDEDWGDIKKMRANGLPEERIAKSYGVGRLYLAHFTQTMTARDAAQQEHHRTPGNW